jgi:hypothetical protein
MRFKYFLFIIPLIKDMINMAGFEFQGNKVLHRSDAFV